MKKFALLGLVLLSCGEAPKVDGLWELREFTVDMYDRRFKPTYIQFNPDGSFSVSKESGDVQGLYQVDKKLISLSSNDDKWFNRQWSVFASAEELVLNDVRNNGRGAQMRFGKIEKFPSFDEFMVKLSGKWQLYKIEEKGKVRRVNDTFINIADESYSIMEGDSISEKGSMSVNTRHHKITFESMDITWNVRFVWDDLRLENEELGIMYRLRKAK